MRGGPAAHGERRPAQKQTEEHAPHGATVPVAVRYRMGTMGYNPYRRFRARPLDYVLLAVVFLIGIVLLAWALRG